MDHKVSSLTCSKATYSSRTMGSFMRTMRFIGASSMCSLRRTTMFVCLNRFSMQVDRSQTVLVHMFYSVSNRFTRARSRSIKQWTIAVLLSQITHWLMVNSHSNKAHSIWVVMSPMKVSRIIGALYTSSMMLGRRFNVFDSLRTCRCSTTKTTSLSSTFSMEHKIWFRTQSTNSSIRPERLTRVRLPQPMNRLLFCSVTTTTACSIWSRTRSIVDWAKCCFRHSRRFKLITWLLSKKHALSGLVLSLFRTLTLKHSMTGNCLSWRLRLRSSERLNISTKRLKSSSTKMDQTTCLWVITTLKRFRLRQPTCCRSTTLMNYRSATRSSMTLYSSTTRHSNSLGM